ncbi:RNA polymerase sigma factor [Subtercola lobariae]|uniref:RNA polymerase sigma factor n=1 Tax=Subtercola lobariae TaxID=1588641 RepID=A0A917B2X3_9MICO|nr:RNA polymerase sigma factor [Subtercola lobariae]GGF14762.1 RNA polymerase sigma factor [Subtercola lobariae]
MAPENGNAQSVAHAVESVWRAEAAQIVATLARFTGDLGFAEDLAQDALTDALAQWPVTGIPSNGAAWLTTVGKRKAVDAWRRQQRLDTRYESMGHGLLTDQQLENAPDAREMTSDGSAWNLDEIDDDVLRLVFVACHPVLSREAQVCLTLRVVGGLSSAEIARAVLVPVATVQQRIVRAKRVLRVAKVPFEVPERSEFQARLGAVLEVVYLIFNEGYVATSGDTWGRVDVAAEAMRLGVLLAGLLPREPEVHALVALMQFQSSRFDARTTPDGEPVLLFDQDRSLWNHALIARGEVSLARADALGRGRGPYALQAAIAECHATSPTADDTDWAQIVLLYEALGQLNPSPVIDLNRAVAVSMATGPASALVIVDRLVDANSLAGYSLLHAVRGDLLARLGRAPDARLEFEAAAALTSNEREQTLLLAKARGTPPTVIAPEEPPHTTQEAATGV